MSGRIDGGKPSFMRKLCNATLCLFLACACACDTVRLAADSSAELFARAQPAFEQYFDYETAGKAAPAGIIQLEGILRIVPENERILLMTIGAYLGYGVGWIEDRLEEADAADDFEQMVHLRGRLRLMYTRAWDLGKHALRLRADGFDDAVAGGVDSLSSWLEKNFDQPEDAEILLFAAQAWAAKIIQSLNDIDSVADFPLAKVVLERSVELDPSFYFMQGKMFLALVAAQQFPPDMEKSRKLFDEVLSTNRAAIADRAGQHGSILRRCDRRLRALQELARGSPRGGRRSARGSPHQRGRAPPGRTLLTVGASVLQQRGGDSSLIRNVIPLTLVLFLSFLVRGSAPIPAYAEATTTLRVATLLPPGSAYNDILRAWNRTLKKETDNRVQLRFYTGGSQGDERDFVRKMRVGQMDAAIVTTTGLGILVRPVLVLTLPGLIESYDQLDRARAALERPFLRSVSEKRRRAAQRGRTRERLGFSRLTSSRLRAISSP